MLCVCGACAEGGQWKNFKTLEPIRSWSAFHYYHVLVVVNHPMKRYNLSQHRPRPPLLRPCAQEERRTSSLQGESTCYREEALRRFPTGASLRKLGLCPADLQLNVERSNLGRQASPGKVQNRLWLRVKLYKTPSRWVIIVIYDLLLLHILVLKHFLSLLLAKETILLDSP